MRPGGQREKGKTFERLIAANLRAVGFIVRRGRQAEGAVEPDLVVAGLPLWLECGHGAAMTGAAKLRQAEAERGRAITPASGECLCVAVTRRNREPIRVTMRVADVLRLAHASPRAMVQIALDQWIDLLLAWTRQAGVGVRDNAATAEGKSSGE